MKVIFLDIDGVLNSRKFFELMHENKIRKIPGVEGIPDFQINQIDRFSMNHLRRAVEETGAKIVISSTWRIGKSVEDFIRLFAAHGWEDFPVIGMTGFKSNGHRGEEIQEWLNNAESEIEDFLILDDDSDMTEEQIENGKFLKVDNEHGFSLSHCVRIMTHFSK